LQFFDDFFFIGEESVGRLEVVLDVDAKALLRQVADVAERGFKHEVRSEEFAQGLDFGRGLDDHQRFCHARQILQKYLADSKSLGGKIFFGEQGDEVFDLLRPPLFADEEGGVGFDDQ